MDPEIKRYDKDSHLDPNIGEQVVDIFRNNYPQYHLNETREKDVAKRANQMALNALLDEGRIIFTVQDVRDKVLGLLEMREADVGDGVYIMLVWIIIDALERGKGFASELHEAFKTESKERISRISKPSCLLLAVHPDNPAMRVYESWGYIRDGRLSEDGKVYMYKNL